MISPIILIKMNTYKSTLKKLSFIAISSLLLISCDDDDDAVQVQVNENATFQPTINLTQFVDGDALAMNTTDFRYTNAMSQRYNVTKLQYLISHVTFNKADGSEFIIDEYHYIDLADPSTTTFIPETKVPQGDYTSISFTFGFDEEHNITGAYTDLNTVGWNWPTSTNTMFGDLGGGYHFMRLEGDFLDSSGNVAQYRHHMGTARNTSTTPFTFTPNHFDAQLANSAISINADFSFDIEMNIEEWYQNPTNWDLNVYNAPIMPVYGAQRLLNANGPSVFTVKLN